MKEYIENKVIEVRVTDDMENWITTKDVSLTDLINGLPFLIQADNVIIEIRTTKIPSEFMSYSLQESEGSQFTSRK